MKTMKRRDWLKGLGIGAAATAAGRGPRLSAAEEAEAIRGRVRTASEPSKLKITDLRVVRMPTVMGPYVIRLDTNQGISGYGEVRDGSSPTYALMLKSRLLGENPCHVDRVFRKLKQFGHHARQAGGVVAVEMACWDLAGKAWGVPCWQMLGGKFRDQIRVYADTPTNRDPEIMGRRLKERREKGFTFLKMDIGLSLVQQMEGTVTAPSDQGRDPRSLYGKPSAMVPHPFTNTRITEKGLKQIQEYVGRVRDIVGWDIPLAADHFGHFAIEDAIKLAQALDPFNLAWLEDMVPWHYTDQYVRLRNSCKTPILTGEDIYLKEGFLPLFEKQAIAICHPDMMTAGGLLETKKIGDLAMEHGIGMAMHMAGSPVGLFGSIHCAAATENFQVLEYHDVDTPAYEDLFRGVPKPIFKDGFMQVPNGPGFGIELNEEAIKAGMRARRWDVEKLFFRKTDEWNEERSNDRHWS